MRASERGLVFDIRRFSTHDGDGLRTTVFLRVDFSQPIQMVSLSVSAAAVSRCTCSGEGAMQPLRQAETHSPQSVQGSQSLTRFGRVKISSP